MRQQVNRDYEYTVHIIDIGAGIPIINYIENSPLPDSYRAIRLEYPHNLASQQTIENGENNDSSQ